MPLNLNDLMKKAEKKGIVQKNTTCSSEEFLRPWQYESVLFVNDDGTPKSNIHQIGDETEINLTQTQHKVRTNLEKNEDNLEEKLADTTQKTCNKVTTNRQQSDNKVTTNRQQSDNKVTTAFQQSDNRSDNTTDNKVATKWQQSGNKVATKSVFSELVGLQRNIIIFIYKECKNSRSKITSALSLEYIATYVKHSTKVIKITIQRLEKKGYLTRVEFKNGRGGWSRYELPDSVYQNVILYETDNKLATNWQQTGNKLTTKVATEVTTTPLSSSSILNINKTTTTADTEKKFLPDEWLKIDTSPLEHIFFSTTQLRQLVDKNIPEVVQESINYFSCEILQEPEKYKKPLNVLMGVLRQGNGWAAPQGYEAPKDKALREYTDRKKSETEKRNQFLNDLVNLEFSDWQAKLSQDELEKIVPEEIRNSRLTAAKTSTLKNYFRDQILIPRLKTEGVL